MLTNNFAVRPDKDGDMLQKYAADILRLNPHAVVPHDVRGARQLLDALQKDMPKATYSGADQRLTQAHEIYNGMLPRLAQAKRLGLRPPNAKPPFIPSGGGATADELQALREYSAQLDIDIEEFQSTTPEQRRIMKLETQLKAVIAHSNGLVDALRNDDRRITRLEAIIQGPQAA
jgi:hypothetical protein